MCLISSHLNSRVGKGNVRNTRHIYIPNVVRTSGKRRRNIHVSDIIRACGDSRCNIDVSNIVITCRKRCPTTSTCISVPDTAPATVARWPPVSRASADVLRFVPAFAVTEPSIVSEPPPSSTVRTPVELLAIVTRSALASVPPSRHRECCIINRQRTASV